MSISQALSHGMGAEAGVEALCVHGPLPHIHPLLAHPVGSQDILLPIVAMPKVDDYELLRADDDYHHQESNGSGCRSQYCRVRVEGIS